MNLYCNSCCRCVSVVHFKCTTLPFWCSHRPVIKPKHNALTVYSCTIDPLVCEDLWDSLWCSCLPQTIQLQRLLSGKKKKHAPPPRKDLLLLAHPALYVTFPGWAAQPSWWWLWGTHSCVVVSLQGTCSETGIRLVPHPELPASRLQCRLPEMGCQGHRASSLNCCCSSSTRRCREIVTLLCLFEARWEDFKEPLKPAAPVSPLVYCLDNLKEFSPWQRCSRWVITFISWKIDSFFRPLSTQQQACRMHCCCIPITFRFWGEIFWICKVFGHTEVPSKFVLFSQNTNAIGATHLNEYNYHNLFFSWSVKSLQWHRNGESANVLQTHLAKIKRFSTHLNDPSHSSRVCGNLPANTSRTQFNDHRVTCLICEWGRTKVS